MSIHVTTAARVVWVAAKPRPLPGILNKSPGCFRWAIAAGHRIVISGLAMQDSAWSDRRGAARRFGSPRGALCCGQDVWCELPQLRVHRNKNGAGDQEGSDSDLTPVDA